MMIVFENDTAVILGLGQVARDGLCDCLGRAQRHSHMRTQPPSTTVCFASVEVKHSFAPGILGGDDCRQPQSLSATVVWSQKETD